MLHLNLSVLSERTLSGFIVPVQECSLWECASLQYNLSASKAQKSCFLSLNMKLLSHLFVGAVIFSLSASATLGPQQQPLSLRVFYLNVIIADEGKEENI